ncbi:MAG: hypothetical protein NG747_07100 [Candidatus Brocadia sp.]|nr:hypothetical protein [Candidatus Brocadia sp.]
MIVNTEQIKTLVSKYYPYFGINKQQEISRLLFEIVKRERIDYTKIAENLPKPPSRFSAIKDYLLKRRYPSFAESNVEIIKSYKQHVGKRRFGITDYNRRMENFYLVREDYDFFKKCPCSSKSAHCGYYVVNLGSGCPYECTYCVLQDYINSPGIILPANIEEFFSAFRDLGRNIRCGSCELTDSLAFDHITGYSPRIVEFFRHYPKTLYELKT